MLNNANYSQLKLWLQVEGYNISIFEDCIVASIIGEYFLVDTGKQDYTISIFQEDNGKIEILVEEKINNEWYKVEQKYYKTAKGAFNKIEQLMNK